MPTVPTTVIRHLILIFHACERIAQEADQDRGFHLILQFDSKLLVVFFSNCSILFKTNLLPSFPFLCSFLLIFAKQSLFTCNLWDNIQSVIKFVLGWGNFFNLDHFFFFLKLFIVLEHPFSLSFSSSRSNLNTYLA